jgi:hypothetical protein
MGQLRVSLFVNPESIRCREPKSITTVLGRVENLGDRNTRYLPDFAIVAIAHDDQEHCATADQD